MRFTYEHRPVTHADGARADVYVARIPAASLRFADIIQPDVRARLRDAAHLRHYQARVRGTPDPVIVAFGCLEQDRPVGDLFPGTPAITASGEHILSANSWITYVLRTALSRGWLRWGAGSWVVDAGAGASGWRAALEAVISWLVDAGRLWLDVGPEQRYPASLAFEGFDALRNLIPVGRCGFARDVAWTARPRLVFNSAFFLLEHDDFLSHHSALGNPYGLYVTAGRIVRPPLYRRAAIWHTPDRGWRTGAFGLEDITIALPAGTVLYPEGAKGMQGLPFHTNPVTSKDVALYTRLWGVATQGRVLGHTPESPDRLEFTVVDAQIVGWQRGGGLQIPQNGFVLSFAPDVLVADATQALQQYGQLAYRFARPEHQAIDRAIQCGPQLARDGVNVLTAHALADEEFWISREMDGEYIVGAVPTEYPDDVDRTRAGRAGLGIDPAGNVVLVVVPGHSKTIAQADAASAGATLVELADYLLAAGAVEAINLDGGGSTQAFVDGGMLARQGDPRGYSGVTFDRMVPAIGVVDAAGMGE